MAEKSVILVGFILILFAGTVFLWCSNVILSGLFGVQSISIFRWLSVLMFPTIFTFWGLQRKSLSISGAVSGFFIGFVITLSNYCFLACLSAAFVSSSKATKFKSRLKEKFKLRHEEDGQRNWVQVISNGLVAMLIAVIYINDCGCRETAVDKKENYLCTLLSYAYLGALSCLNGDTWASEFGPVLKFGETVVLITNFKKVPKGTNGGISVAGLIASFLGGLLIGFSFFLSLHLLIPSHKMDLAPSQWHVIFVGGIGGFLGSLIDSLLGATLQYSGVNAEGIVVENPKEAVKKISGTDILNNHSVNFVSILATSLILPYVAFYIA